jgi:pyruvate dehydrogenase E2 component (dihydrolipoamide acetyltransferase)
MAEIITMPRLSDTMEEGTVATWLKQVGDKIEEGDMIAEIETDKATMEFESFNEGVLLYIGVEEGGSAPVDSLLAIIGEAGEDVSALIADFSKGKEVEKVTPKSVKAEAPKTEVSKESPKEVVQEEVIVTTATGKRIFVSPLAKKMAAERFINLATVKGSGENGRIIKRDIENYQVQAVAASNTVASEVTVAARPLAIGEESFKEIPNSKMRKIIAKRLGESKFTAPHYYLMIAINMDNAIESRKAINALPETKVSFNDMVVKAVAMALKKHPKVNSQWNEDKIKINHHVHVGVAVAVEDGLVVPVVKFTDQQSLTQINAAVKDLAGRARVKKILPNEMEGSTFTVSNLGMFGITEFTSIINQPNSAIMSVGAIIEQPIVKDGEIVVGNMMKISMACDHRTVDGATGAAFLKTFKEFMENPVTMLA